MLTVITFCLVKTNPLQAYKFVQTIQDRENAPDCLKWLDDYMVDKKIIHDMAYINDNRKTIEQIKEEEKHYKSLD